MKQNLVVSVIGFFAILGLFLFKPVFAATDNPPAPAKEAGAPAKKVHHERHPAIHAAMHKLNKAKEDLEKASHDFGGHRVKAIQAIDQAIQELKAALQYDKK